MTRKPRHCPPHSLQHIIFRFLDKRFRFVDEVDRSRYLTLFGEQIVGASWKILSFALMSNHGHFGAYVGTESLKQVFHRPHSRFAAQWHRRHGGLGPVFADRPANHNVQQKRMGELIAYNHMDPVRNGLVTNPSESRWTSHRAYLRLETPPSWLDVEYGLSLCGFDDRDADRKHFDEFVRSCDRFHWQSNTRDDFDVDPHEPVSTAISSSSRTRPPLSCAEIIAVVASQFKTPVHAMIHGKGRASREIARLRCIVARVAVQLGHSQIQIAAALQLTPQAVNQMLRRPEIRPLAEEIIEVLALIT